VASSTNGRTATSRAVVAEAILSLERAGVPTPRLDAELLIAEALGVDRGALFAAPEQEVSEEVAETAAELLRRRCEREPVAYILGKKGFRWIELEVDPRVLIPRPETELLVEVALDLAQGARVHEVGVGSGAVALAVKHERPDLRVSASDASADALDVARRNAAALDLDVDLMEARDLPPGSYDLVLANMPYIREDEWDALAPELKLYEPPEAFLAGPDGLDAIRGLVGSAPSGTRLALEHDRAQAESVRRLLAEAESRRGLDGGEWVTAGLVP